MIVALATFQTGQRLPDADVEIIQRQVIEVGGCELDGKGDSLQLPADAYGGWSRRGIEHE